MHLLLLFPYSLSYPVKSICANQANPEEVVCGSEATDGKVATVLDGLVAASWRHILRHYGGLRAPKSSEDIVGFPVGGVGDQWVVVRSDGSRPLELDVVFGISVHDS